MLIRALSDLHAEYSELLAPLVEADITLLCGDIFTNEKQLPDDLCDFFKSKCVIGIAGNHEFYGKKIDTYTPKLYDIYSRHNGIFLNNDYVTVSSDLKKITINNPAQIDGIRFYGTTMWSDFKMLAGDDYNLMKAQCSLLQSNSVYERGVNDYKFIREANRNYAKFTPLSASMLHSKAISFLTNALSLPFDGIRYVMTHHAPTINVMKESERTKTINIGDATKLDDFILQFHPDYWQFGHIHDAIRGVEIGKTKMITNTGRNSDSFSLDYMIKV